MKYNKDYFTGMEPLANAILYDLNRLAEYYKEKEEKARTCDGQEYYRFIKLGVEEAIDTVKQVLHMQDVVERVLHIQYTGLFKARGANTLVFDQRGIENILEPYNEEHEIKWSQVKADTPILVRNNEDRTWYRRYFARYQDGKVRAWNNGNTSWTGTCTTAWDFAKLAEAGDSE